MSAKSRRTGGAEKAATAKPPALSLAVQYAAPIDDLPRWRVRAWVQHVLRELTARQVANLPQRLSLTIRFVNRTEGRELNRSFRDLDYATNVLTFVYGADPEGTLHADVALCVDVLTDEAREQNKPLLAHAAHLVAHATLHALGYDHEDDAEAEVMESLEAAVLARLKIPNPYAHD